jgi:flagellin-like protein
MPYYKDGEKVFKFCVEKNYETFINNFQGIPFMNKRALSPLIATVLLIAFAVALGVMIMTWTSQLPDSGSKCGEIVLSDQGICYTGDSISLKIRNTGIVAVAAVSVEINDDIKRSVIEPKDSQIPVSQVLGREVDYIKTGRASVKIKAVAENNGELTECPAPAITVPLLNNC